MGAVALYLALELSALDCHPSDIHRFPRPDAVRAAKAIYESRLEFLHYQQAWYPREYWFWQDRIDELKRWYKAWEHLGDARTLGNEERYLRQLRYLIGEEAYAAGQMPGPP